MKRLVCIALVCCLLPVAALAGTTVESVVASLKRLLTEEHGYTQAQADALVIRVREDKDHWHVEFQTEDDPEGIDYAGFDKEDGRYLYGSLSIPNEERSSSRTLALEDLLALAKQRGWFAAWSDAAKRMLQDAIVQAEILARGSLRKMRSPDARTAAHAIEDLFVSAMGSRADWSDETLAWRNETLAEYGFAPADLAQMPDMTQGIRRSFVTLKGNSLEAPNSVEVWEFVGEAPEEIAAALTRKELAGWTLLAGAVARVETEQMPIQSYGVAAMEKGKQRLLVALSQEKPGDAWTVAPAGEKALLPGRALAVTYDEIESNFYVSYPTGDAALERFLVSPPRADCEREPCRLLSYERLDWAKDEGTVVKVSEKYYEILQYAGEQIQTATFPMGPLLFTVSLDAEAFPKSVEACEQASGEIPQVPEGYVITSNVHLRESKSTRSRSLAQLKSGALAVDLGVENGDPHPWYHVRIGSLEGYVSATYINAQYTDVSFHRPLYKVMTTTETPLTESAGGGKTLRTLAVGVKAYLLAESGSFYYICIPRSGEPGERMDVDGTYGWVRKSDVEWAATSEQLDWLQ